MQMNQNSKSYTRTNTNALLFCFFLSSSKSVWVWHELRVYCQIIRHLVSRCIHTLNLSIAHMVSFSPRFHWYWWAQLSILSHRLLSSVWSMKERNWATERNQYIHTAVWLSLRALSFTFLSILSLSISCLLFYHMHYMCVTLSETNITWSIANHILNNQSHAKRFQSQQWLIRSICFNALKQHVQIKNKRNSNLNE